MGMCCNADITVGIAAELGWSISEKIRVNQRALSCVICSEYAASAGDPIVRKKARTSSSGSVPRRHPVSTSKANSTQQKQRAYLPHQMGFEKSAQSMVCTTS